MPVQASIFFYYLFEHYIIIKIRMGATNETGMSFEICERKVQDKSGIPVEGISGELCAAA
jgi:hypothetical protein